MRTEFYSIVSVYVDCRGSAVMAKSGSTHQDKVALNKLCRDGRYKTIERFMKTSEDRASQLHSNAEDLKPLLEAVKNGHAKIAELLLKYGADVNCRSLTDSSTPLHLAASSGHVECVRVLLANGADMTKINGVGRTPLYEAKASLNEQHAVVKLLKCAG